MVAVHDPAVAAHFPTVAVHDPAVADQFTMVSIYNPEVTELLPSFYLFVKIQKLYWISLSSINFFTRLFSLEK
ncbi:hypothetical protein JW964_19515 [candidate division KSB1 bacterium]|nr:hypothetical protein [candidate division KSB1 bacterium]